jgi:hypothetical protein
VEQVPQIPQALGTEGKAFNPQINPLAPNLGTGFGQQQYGFQQFGEEWGSRKRRKRRYNRNSPQAHAMREIQKQIGKMSPDQAAGILQAMTTNPTQWNEDMARACIARITNKNPWTAAVTCEVKNSPLNLPHSARWLSPIWGPVTQQYRQPVEQVLKTLQQGNNLAQFLNEAKDRDAALQAVASQLSYQGGSSRRRGPRPLDDLPQPVRDYITNTYGPQQNL